MKIKQNKARTGPRLAARVDFWGCDLSSIMLEMIIKSIL